MTPAGTIAHLHSYLRRFAVDRKAISSVEFALILPFMVFTYVGSAELGDGMAIYYKTTETARTVTDLTSQYVTIDPTTMGNILGASAQIVAPFSSSGMIVTLSQINPTNASGQGTISWSCSLNGTARTVGSTVTLPTSLQTESGVSIIWGEVTYPYTPAMGYAIAGTINLYQSIYFYPRLSNSVTLTSGC
ncbi:MAG TPA: TadE/TadG family type IV pilus assembly protein [Xanthobacteraceae bacterium]|nr:TadE/TadG family type IV pilus assembly protein [Xanthobacteraceae bacterium]